MKTARDHLASQSVIPAPPPDATHVLLWEPYGPSRARWVLVPLDGSPDDVAAFLDGPPDLHPGKLLEEVAGALGRPVRLSQIEADGEAAYYVTLA